MTTYSVRCRHHACRHRRVTKVHPEDYKVVPKCSVCGNRKGWRIEGRQYLKRDRCYCAGYPHPHRKTSSKYCDFHPQGFYNQAKRQGVKDEDIPLEFTGRLMKATEDVPF